MSNSSHKKNYDKAIQLSDKTWVMYLLWFLRNLEILCGGHGISLGLFSTISINSELFCYK